MHTSARDNEQTADKYSDDGHDNDVP